MALTPRVLGVMHLCAFAAVALAFGPTSAVGAPSRAASTPRGPAVVSVGDGNGNGTAGAPFFRVVIQERGLALLSAEAVPTVNAALAALAKEGKLRVDDVAIVLDTHKIGIGKVLVNVSNIVITDISVADNGTQLELEEPASPSDGRIEVALTGLALRIAADFRWKDIGGIIKASDHGTVDITASRGSGSVDMTFAPAGDKQPHLTSAVRLDIPQFDFKFHGKVSWIYNALGSALHGVIKGAVEKKLQAALETAMNVDLSEKIDKAPTSVRLGGGKSAVELGVQVDAFFERATAPLALSTGVSMTVGDAEDPTRVVGCPLTSSTPLPPLAPRANDAMVQLLLSDAVPSCVSWVFFNNGGLNSSLFPLGTTETPWGVLIPPLKAKYPGGVPVLVRATASYPPRVVSTRALGLTGAVGFRLNTSVNDSGAVAYADTLEVDAGFGIDLAVRALPGGGNATLVGNVSTLNLTATVADSAIGPISPLPLRLFATLFDGVVRGLLNKVLQRGVSVSPPDGVLRNASVFTEDGFVTVAADFSKLLDVAAQ